MRPGRNGIIKFFLIVAFIGITLVPKNVHAEVIRCKYQFSYQIVDLSSLVTTAGAAAIASLPAMFGQMNSAKDIYTMTSSELNNLFGIEDGVVKTTYETYVLSTDNQGTTLTRRKRLRMKDTQWGLVKEYDFADSNGIPLNGSSCPDISLYMGQLLTDSNTIFAGKDSCASEHVVTQFACSSNFSGTSITEEEYEKLTKSQVNANEPNNYGNTFEENSLNKVQDCSTIFGNVDQNGNFVSGSLGELIQILLNYIKILGPILIILLSGVDFIKAVFSSDEKELKQAQSKLYIRLIAMVAIFLIPQIIQILFAIFNNNIANPTCGFK